MKNNERKRKMTEWALWIDKRNISRMAMNCNFTEGRKKQMDQKAINRVKNMEATLKGIYS